MMRRKFFAALLLLVGAQIAASAQGNWLWPVEGRKAGAEILAAPNGHIGQELNYAALFIGGEEGARVVSPVDGTVSDISVEYLLDLTHAFASSLDGRSFDEAISNFVAENRGVDARYVCVSVGIRLDGGTMHIGGLTGDMKLKTGQKIARGELLGLMGHSYRGVREPSVSVSVSKGGKSADPMGGFGLKSSFVPAQEVKPIREIPVEKALEDFDIFTDALQECYPSLYNLMSPERFDSLRTDIRGRIAEKEENIGYYAFRSLVVEMLSNIHDSHFGILPPRWKVEQTHNPPVLAGIYGDTLRVAIASKPYAHLAGRKLLSVNGRDVEALKDLTRRCTYMYDGNVESYLDYIRAILTIGAVYDKGGSYDSEFVFEDGERLMIPQERVGRIDRGRASVKFRTLNQEYSLRKPFRTAMLNDSTALVGLANFQLNKVQMEELGAFVDSCGRAGVANMIVDVRNNPGGEAGVLAKVWSWFATDTLRLNGCERVNKRGGYRAFEHSENYAGITEDIFADYVEIPGIAGFCSTSYDGSYAPDSQIHYGGRLYVLADERSCSAASLFAALTVRSHRGVTVGRETNTAYHFMTALKFVDLCLPHSTLGVSIPLVEVVFDTEVNERVPYGRGVLPDFEVPLRYEEVVGEEDVILGHCLELIGQGRYLEYDNPFAEPEPASLVFRSWSWFLLPLALLTLPAAVIITRRKRK